MWRIDPVLDPMNLSDLKRLGHEGYIGRITHVEGRMSRVSHAPTARQRDPSAPQFLGFPVIYAYTPFDAELPNLTL